MILPDVMGWQGGLLTMSLAVIYFSVVFLINLISVPKMELCFILFFYSRLKAPVDDVHQGRV